MAVNFFDNNCREIPQTNSRFGLCDRSGNEDPAYSDLNNEQDWIAEVKNELNKEIVFIPIDNCIVILKPESKDQESLCDGALLVENDLILVELKNIRTAGWIPDATLQLMNTIRLIRNTHDIAIFKYKIAYICNRKEKHFHVIDQDEKKKFYHETGHFRLHIGGLIIISKSVE